MQYQEFLDHIYQKYSGNVRLELDRMQNLLEDMGNPQDSLSGFHIAGTNGKGSVCATLEALCLAHGLHTGLNTSPHLIDYTERFRLDGKDLPFDRILDLFHRLETFFTKWDASFFEISTAIAFQLFKDEKVQAAVIEVGLGGRLDATNLFKPDVSAITTIGLDHVKTLGNTLELIAVEKAGIIKSGVPLVLGKLEDSPRRIISARADEQQAPLYIYGRDFSATITSRKITGLEFDYYLHNHAFNALKTNLIGEHQAVNIAVALTAFLIFAEKQALPVSEKAVRHALANINWKGRMQVLSTSPVIIADGAHNVQGVQALIGTLEKIFPHRRFRFLLSILADKDYNEMIRLICTKAERVYIAKNQSDRAASVEEQSAAVHSFGVPFFLADSVAQAYRIAVNELGADDILICGGSLYTVGEVLNAVRQSQT